MSARGWNTSYPLRPISPAEVVALFGSTDRALSATGGDESVALLYLNNPDKAASAPPLHPRESWLSAALRERLRKEREAADAAAARSTWQSLEKPSVSAVALAIGSGWRRAKRLLRGVA